MSDFIFFYLIFRSGIHPDRHFVSMWGNLWILLYSAPEEGRRYGGEDFFNIWNKKSSSPLSPVALEVDIFRKVEARTFYSRDHALTTAGIKDGM